MNSWLGKRRRETSSSKSSPSKLEPEWCSLGRDILEEITKRLKTRIDILRLRAVCKDWRSSIPFPPVPIIIIPNPNNVLPLNLQFLPPTTNLGGRGKKAHLLLKQSTLCSLSSTSSTKKISWFVKIEHTESGKVLLKDPFPKMPLENFGKTENGLPNVINLLDYKVIELGKEYSLDFVQEDDKRQEIIEVVELRKVIVGENKEGQFVVMTIHDVTGKMEAWKIGEDRWVVIDNGRRYKDIVYHKGRFYGVDYKGRTIAVEYSSSSSLEITQVVRSTDHVHLRTAYLVESGDDLYLINKKYRLGRLDVFKLDEELGQWVCFMEWLMDRVTLEDGGFYHGEIGGGGCKDNCFYFRDSDHLACLKFRTGKNKEYWD